MYHNGNQRRRVDVLDDDMTFHAEFDGHEPQQFLTLQDAMFWAEDFDSPTGAISFDGQPIIVYDSGSIAVVE